jgi:hypothetical protein
VAKYRKRPVVVDTEQFVFDHVIGRRPLPVGVTRESEGDPMSLVGERVRFFVVTAHGQKTEVQTDDWIIAEPDGRGYYPCKPDSFAATSEHVGGET